MAGPLAAGERVLLVDAKQRRYLLRLVAGASFHTHAGILSHDDVIGREEGSTVTASTGRGFLVLRPTLSDVVLKMPRGAQVIYPKDLGPILVYADIGPGMTVLEAGTGSGALTLGLARAVGSTGRVVTVEQRDDHAAHARKTIERWFGEVPDNVDMRVGDVADMVEEVRPERIVLDLPEPGPTVKAAATFQPTGGVICSYLPTVPQVQSLVEMTRDTNLFAEIEVKEFLMRDWNVKGRSVRPDHSMVGHTGFLIFMRKVADERDSTNPGN